jgi:3-carboxy-cis,cis-muconate cycloisomerase
MGDRLSGLFSGISSRGAVAHEVEDLAWLRAMLEFEAALARACAQAGLIPASAAAAITAVCTPERYDPAAIGRAGADSAQPVVALVASIRSQLDAEVASYAHFGATSQDVLDTAAMLISRRAVAAILADGGRAADTLADLAERHAETSMLGRTLLQPALPTTFGLVAAGWMSGIDAAREALAAAQRQLPLQLGGPVGNLGAYGERAPQVLGELARELGLVVPVLPWHGDRGPVASLGGVLGGLAGAAAKFARDVTLLGQGELAEVIERPAQGRGRSSSIAHKQNPVAAVSTLACALRVPGLVATLYAGMGGELQRAAGAWQAEAETLSELLRLTGAAVSWSAELAERLEVDGARMRANLGEVSPDPGWAPGLVRRALRARGC